LVTAATTSPRIAVVQRGDWAGARRAAAAGGVETYNGQFHTVRLLDDLLRPHPHLSYAKGQLEPEVIEGHGTLRHLPEPIGLTKLLPGRWREWLRARQAIRGMEAFGTTHLLLRLNDVVGATILAWADRRNLPTAVLLAARFNPQHAPDVKLATLANADNVLFLANHNTVATQSAIDCGLRAEKAIAWDLPPDSRPEDFEPKTIDPTARLELAYAGQMIETKGVGDLLDAVAKLHHAGRPVRLRAFGDGGALAQFRRHPMVAAGVAELPGQSDNAVVQRAMRDAHLVVVPSRPEFAEARPFVLGEALSKRTPVVVSDHPIFRGYFTEGVGAHFFPAADAQALADVLAKTAADPAAYAGLSRRTAEAWVGLQIDTTFDDILARLADAWHLA
jgi:glycosyltransferase involved in cell wall biosynthesis